MRDCLLPVACFSLEMHSFTFLKVSECLGSIDSNFINASFFAS